MSIIIPLACIAGLVAAFIRSERRQQDERPAPAPTPPDPEPETPPPRRPSLFDAPELYEEDDARPPGEIDQLQADLDHYERTRAQYEALRETINGEIDAIRLTRARKSELATLHGDPARYTELYAQIDTARDISERREAALQRQLITLENQIYNTEKRLYKARQALQEAERDI